MSIFKKISNWFHSVIAEYKTAKFDNITKKLFIDSVKSQISDRNSFFNMYNIRIDNDNYTQIVYPFSIPAEFQIAGQEWQIKDKLDETSFVVSRFLKTELGYNDYIEGPEYYHLEDPADTNISTSYIAIWNFKPVLKSKKKIYIINSIGSVIIIGLITFGILTFI